MPQTMRAVTINIQSAECYNEVHPAFANHRLTWQIGQSQTRPNEEATRWAASGVGGWTGAVT